MGASGPSSAIEGSQTPTCKDLGVTVSFKTGSSELDTNAKGALDGVAKWMHAKDDRTVKLQGFTDTTGNAAANLVLSEKRADATKNYLVEQGVDPGRISTLGQGEEHPPEASLPASGRTVTFMGCAPPVKVAEAQPPPAPAPEAAPEPEPVEETPPAPIAPVPATPQYEAAAAPPFASKFGFAMLLGGGFQDFTHTNARALTSGGGSWDARIVGGTRSYIGFEAAYVGSANNIRVLGASTNSSLVGNGLEGALRLNVPIVMGASMIEPFGFAGLGWSNFRVTNNRTFTSDFATRSDNVMTVPLGGGIAYTYKAFTLDARGGWTGTYYNNILLTPTTTTTGNRLDHWGVGGNLGVAF